jgi:cytochrome c-type biogenesis protein CcmF
MKITVAAPFFNTIMVPILMVVILLMAIGPLVPWRKVNAERLRTRLLWPFVIGASVAVAMLVFLRPVRWIGPVAVGLGLFALANLFADFLRAVRQRRAQLKEPFLRAGVKTVLGNRRHYGGMIVHLGIVIIALGLVGSGLFRSDETVSMAPGDIVEVAGEKLRFEGVTSLHHENYDAIQGELTLLNSGRVVKPQLRHYPRQQAPTTETSIDSTVLRDVYVVMAQSNDGQKWAIHVYVNPLVRFIWSGGIIILSGVFLSLTSRRRKRDAREEAAGAAEPAR